MNDFSVCIFFKNFTSPNSENYKYNFALVCVLTNK